MGTVTGINKCPSKINDYMTQMVLSLILHLKNVLTVTNILYMKTVLRIYLQQHSQLKIFVMDFSMLPCKRDKTRKINTANLYFILKNWHIFCHAIGWQFLGKIQNVCIKILNWSEKKWHKSEFTKVCNIVPKLHHNFWHFISSQVHTVPRIVSVQCI